MTESQRGSARHTVSTAAGAAGHSSDSAVTTPSVPSLPMKSCFRSYLRAHTRAQWAPPQTSSRWHLPSEKAYRASFTQHNVHFSTFKSNASTLGAVVSHDQVWVLRIR